ncbi:MAG: GDP-mannose 4,6-dehydratase [Candidatus Omnitrophica bacterium]|nr:GDP-mannose 4,6-dehydratase [Candidatus Omnitrophota bacterium]
MEDLAGGREGDGRAGLAGQVQGDPFGTLFRKLGVKAGDHVVGIGDRTLEGWYFAALDQGAHYVGFDMDEISERLAGLFNENFLKYQTSRRLSGSVRAVYGEFSSLPQAKSGFIPSRSQDFVLMPTGVLSDPYPVSDPFEVLKEALRVLKEKGSILVGSYEYTDEGGNAFVQLRRFLEKYDLKDKVKVTVRPFETTYWWMETYYVLDVEFLGDARKGLFERPELAVPLKNETTAAPDHQKRAEVRISETRNNSWIARDTETGQEKGFVYETPFLPRDIKNLDKAWADFHQMVFDFPKILERAAQTKKPVVLVVPEDLDGFSPLADEAPWIEGARVSLAWASAYYRFKELGNVDVRVLRVPRSGVSQKQITKAVQLLTGKKIKPVPGTPEEQFEARMFTLAAVLGTRKVPSKNLVLERRSLTSLDGVGSRPAERVILRPKLSRIPEGKQRILVVGGAGFIGTNLVQALLAEGHQVIVMDSMVSANPFFETIFEGDTDLHLEKWDASRPFEIEGPVDLIFHLGSLASPVDYYGKPLETMRAGLMATKEVLELARRKRARFFFSSTSEVYGDPKVHPQPETYAGAVSPFKKRSQYDESKRGAETLIKLYHERYAGAERLDLRIARLFNTYGPYMRIDDGRVVTNFIQKIFANEPIEIYGDERITRSFGFVDDTLSGILKLVRTEHLAAETPITERVFNIGNDGEFTLRALADLTNRLGEKYLKRTVPIKIVPIKDPTDPNRRRPDLTRARTRLDYKPSVSLREGFEKTFLYFMLHREALKGFDRRSEAREKSAGQAEELRRGVTVLRGGEKGPDYSNGDEEIAIADERARPAGEGLAKKEVHRRSLKDTDSDSRDVWDKIKRTVMNGQGPFEPLEAGRRSEARAYSRRDWLKLTVKGAFAAGLFGFAACCQKEKIDNKEEESHDREGIIFESGNWKIWGTRDTGPEARIVKTPRGNFSEFKVVYRNDQLFSVKGNGYLRSVLPSSYRGPKGEKVDWGTSFVLPGYWSNGVYHHNPKITQAEIREGPDGTVTLKGVMEDQAGNWVAKDLAITFRKPMAESVEAEISFTQTAQKSFSVDAARAGDGEGWKVLQFSSMNIGTAHDADFVMYRDKDGQMASQAVAGENKLIFEKAQPLGGSPVYLANQKPSPWGNRPTTFIQMMPDSSPGVFSAQGWVARSSDPNDDNLGVWVHLDGVKNSYQAGETIARVHAVLGTTRPGLPLVAPSVSPKGVIDGAAVASFMPAEDVRRSEVREGTAREAARTVLQITRAGAKEFAPHADGGYHLDDLLDEANWTRTVLYTGAAAGSFLERTQRFEHETQVIVPADTEVTVTTGGESFTLTEPGIIGMSHGAEASVTVARGEVIVTTADRSPSWYRWTEDSGKNDTGKIWEKGSIVVYRHQGRQNWFDLKNGVSSHTEWMMDSTTQKFPRSLFPPIMGVSRVDYTDRQGIFPFHSLRPAENLHEHPVVNANWELVETYMVTRGAAVLAYFLQDEQGRFRPETVVLRPGDAAFVRPGTIHDLVAVEAPYEHVVTFTPSVHQYGFSFKRQVNDDEVGMDRAALTEAAMNLLRSEARFRSEAQESDDEDRFNSQLRATIGAFRLTPAQVETVRTKEKFIADIYRGVLEELFPGGVLWVKALGSSARLTFAGGQPDFDICGNVQANESVLEQKLGFLFDGIREKFVQEGYEFKPSTYTANGFRRQLHALNKTGPYYVLVLDVKSLETGETLHADLTVKFDQEEEEIKKGISDTYLIRFKEEIARIRKERGDRAAEDLLADIRFTRDVFQKTGIENGRFRGGFVSVNAEQLVMQTGGFDQAMEFLFRIGTEDGRAISLKDAKRKPWPLRVITPAVDGEMLGWIDEDHWDRLIDLSRRYVQQKKDGRFDLSSLISPRSEARAAQSSPAGPRLEARNIPAAVQREAKPEVVTTLGMVARERGRRAGTTNTGLGVKLTEPVVIVVEKARLDALSGTAMRQLMAFAAINREKLYWVVPDLLQGPESSYVAEFKALGVRVMRELPGIARDAKTSVIGLSDKEQDTAEAFRERLRPGVAAGVREYFALEEGEGLFLALLVEQPEDLPLKNGFRYDRSGRFRDALGSLLRTLSDYVVVSKVIGAAA